MCQNIKIEEQREKLLQKLNRLNAQNQQIIRKYVKKCTIMLKNNKRYNCQEAFILHNSDSSSQQAQSNANVKDTPDVDLSHSGQFPQFQSQTNKIQEQNTKCAENNEKEELVACQYSQFQTIESEVAVSQKTQNLQKSQKMGKTGLYQIPSMTINNQIKSQNLKFKKSHEKQPQNILNPIAFIDQQKRGGSKIFKKQFSYRNKNPGGHFSNERNKKQSTLENQPIQQSQKYELEIEKKESLEKKGHEKKPIAGCGSACVLSYYKKFVEFVKSKNQSPVSDEGTTKENKAKKIINRYIQINESKQKKIPIYKNLDSYELQKSIDNKALLNLQNMQFKEDTTKTLNNKKLHQKKMILSKMKPAYQQQLFDSKLRHDLSSGKIKKIEERVQQYANLQSCKNYKNHHSSNRPELTRNHQMHSDAHLQMYQYSDQKNNGLPQIHIRRHFGMHSSIDNKLLKNNMSSASMLLNFTKKRKKNMRMQEEEQDKNSIRIEAIPIEQIRSHKVYLKYSELFHDKNNASQVY